MFGLTATNIFLYFLFPIAVVSISIYLVRSREVNFSSYFFANRNVSWFFLGISFLIPSITGPYLISLSSGKFTVEYLLLYFCSSVFMLLVYEKFFSRIITGNDIHTLPEYFEKKYNRSMRFFVSGLYIFFNLVIRLMMVLVFGSILINLITGIDISSSLLFFLIISGIYVIIGGLHADIYGNSIQLFFIVLGVVGFLIWVLQKSEDGFFNFNGISQITGVSGGHSQFAWYELIFGVPVLAFWFWFADHLIIQKSLSTNNGARLKKATYFAILMQIVPLLIFSLFLLVINSSQSSSFESSITSFLKINELPESLKLILIIAVSAVLIASIANIFNGTTALVTLDFYRTIKPQTSERKLILVGRFTTIILLLISIPMIPLVKEMNFNSGIMLFRIFTYFASMITALLIVSVLSKKSNSTGAIITLSISTIIVLFRVIGEIFPSRNGFWSAFTGWYMNSGFLEFSIFVFIVSALSLTFFNRLKPVSSGLSSGKEIKEKLINIK